MIDPLTAFAAIKSATGIIQESIKVGKGLHDLASPIMKWANAESHMDVAASRKGKTITGKLFGKFSTIEQNAIAAHLRKEEVKRMKAELREIFLLYAPNGLQQWEDLQKEIAHQRALTKKRIQQQIKEKEELKKIMVVLGLVIFGFVLFLLEMKYLLN